MATTFLRIPCAVKPPTRKHRPAVWECMLGTVYALNNAGECKYFDYDIEGAKAFAGVDPSADLRLHPVSKLLNFQYVKSGVMEGNPGLGRLVLWMPKA